MAKFIITGGNMTAVKKHEYHFIIDRRMKARLQDLNLFKEYGSLSRVIVKIIALLEPVVKNMHRWEKERESRYLPVPRIRM